MESSCAAVLGNIELVTLILLCLPVKYVLRCKCVSKEWLAIISNPRFCYSHTLRMCQTSSPSLLLHRFRHRLHFEIVSLTNSDANPSPVRTCQYNLLYSPHLFFEILQSCNGFLLCKASKFILGIHKARLFSQYYYRIFNPTFKNFYILEFPSENFNQEISALYLAFDPFRSPHFKVISFRRVISYNWDRDITIFPIGQTHFDFKVNIYSSQTGCWSEDGVCFTALANTRVDSGVYCNSAIHWFTLGGDCVYFDVERQFFNTMPNPASIDNNNLVVKYFGESRGHLHLILINSHESLTFDILELKKDYSCWIMRYHVDLNYIGEDYINPMFSVLSVVRQANEVDSMLVLFVDSKILSYNLKDHTPRIIFEANEVGKSFQYLETLLNI